MQCDITNIIRDTGPPPSSGMASRADSNITTPANCHSDNDELDERISVKSSLNPSRESSLPPEEVKRETPTFTKSKEPEVAPPKLHIKIKSDQKEDKKGDIVIKTEEMISDVTMHSAEIKNENIDTTEHFDNKSNKDKSPKSTKTGSVSITECKEPENNSSNM